MRLRLRRIWFGLLILPILLGVWMWRAASWRPKIARVSESGILALNWSSDGGTLKCATGDGHIQTLSSWSLQTLSTKGTPAKWLSAQFSNDGHLLLAGEMEQLTLINADSGRTIWKRSLQSRNQAANTKALKDKYSFILVLYGISAFALSPEGNRIVESETSAESSNTLLFDVQRNHVLPSPHTQHPNGVLSFEACSSFSFSHDHLLAFESDSSAFSVINEKSQKLLWSTRFEAVYSSCFSPNGKYLALTGPNDTLKILDARTGRSLQSLVSPDVGSSLAWSPDSRFLADAGGSADVGIFRIGHSGWWRRYPTKTRNTRSLSFSPDSSRLAIGTSDGQVQLWRVK